MENLIKEIQEKRDNLYNYAHSKDHVMQHDFLMNGVMQLHYYGKIEAYDDVLKILNDYKENNK